MIVKSSRTFVWSSTNDTWPFSLNVAMLEKIWKPDTYFHNGLNSYLHSITRPNKLLRISENGDITYSIRSEILCGGNVSVLIVLHHLLSAFQFISFGDYFWHSFYEEFWPSTSFPIKWRPLVDRMFIKTKSPLGFAKTHDASSPRTICLWILCPVCMSTKWEVKS